MLKERTLNSSELDPVNGINIGAESGELDLYDGLRSPYTADVVVLTGRHISQIADFARQSVVNYGPNGTNACKEPELTFAQTNFGMPTLIGRVDCSVDAFGNIMPYELEDSPSGIGISDTVHQAIGANGVAQLVREHYESLLGQVPFVIVAGARGHGTDDPLVVGDENYFYEASNQSIPYKLGVDQLVIVKAIPGQPTSLDGYRSLVDRSVCTMESEGDKTYGERIGLHQRVKSADDLHTDLQTGEVRSQVLKRSVGSMAMGIKAYLTPEGRAVYGKGRTVTLANLKSSLANFVAADGHAYVQDFRPAIRSVNPEGRKNMIMRVYTLFEPSSDPSVGSNVRVIGGCYVARSEIVVHGASNAICGAVVVE